MKQRIPLYLFLLFIAVGIESHSQQTKLIDGIIGTVGNEIVLYSDLQASILEMGSEADATSTCSIYENLMYQKLLLNQSKLDSLVVSDSEVQQQVDRRLDYFIQMFGSVEEFEKYYNKSSSQLKDEYFDLIKDQLLVQQMQDAITKNLKVTPADVLRYYQTIPQDSLPLIGEQVQYSQIVAAPKVREEERNRILFVMDSIRSRLASGRGSMMLEASKWSEDPGSKYKGGCYPLQRRGSFVPEYEAAVYNTIEGQYSPVFKTEYGYHFVKVIEKRGDFYESCHILMSPKMQTNDLDFARIKLDSVNALLADSMSFAQAAIVFSTDEETSNAGGRVMNNATGGTKHDVAQMTAELNLILMEMKVGEVSQPILKSNADGTQAYVIYRLDARSDAHIANIKDDYEIFKNVAEGEAKQKEADKWVKKKLATTFSAIDPEYAACSFQFPWNISVQKP